MERILEVINAIANALFGPRERLVPVRIPVRVDGR
jgi:hypothetical protein